MSSIISCIPDGYEYMEDHPLVPREHVFLSVNIQLVKLIGTHAALVFAALAEHTQICGTELARINDGWLLIHDSYICKRTGLTFGRVHKTLNRLKHYGIIDTLYLNKLKNRCYYRLLPIKDIEEIKDKRSALSHKTRPRRRSVPGAANHCM